MRKNLHKLTQLSSQFSPKIRICFRCNMKHTRKSVSSHIQTPRTPLRLVFSTHFSVFGYVMKHSSSCFINYIPHLPYLSIHLLVHTILPISHMPHLISYMKLTFINNFVLTLSQVNWQMNENNK